MDIELKILRYDPENDRKGHWEFIRLKQILMKEF